MSEKERFAKICDEVAEETDSMTRGLVSEDVEHLTSMADGARACAEAIRAAPEAQGGIPKGWKLKRRRTGNIDVAAPGFKLTIGQFNYYGEAADCLWALADALLREKEGKE